MIGDPDQAIYGFRGADAQCFQKLAQALGQPAGDPFDRKLPLHAGNIRLCPAGDRPLAPGWRPNGSWPPIVQQGARCRCSRLIRPLRRRFMWPRPSISWSAAWICWTLISSPLAPCGNRRWALAISPCSTVHIGRLALLEECLQKEGIPYVVTGRESFLDDAEVRLALAFFRHMLVPMDAISARQALTALGAERLAELENAWRDVKWAREKPWKLVERWMTENDLTESVALAYLRNTALTYKTLAECLQNLALGQEGDIRRSGGKVYHSDAVTLSTLHGAKGLEFPAVFLCGVKAGSIPLQGVHLSADLDEERRLFYVGLTRAQEELILLTSREEPSPFLDDMPEALLERGTVPAKPRADISAARSILNMTKQADRFGDPPALLMIRKLGSNFVCKERFELLPGSLRSCGGGR